MFRFLSDENFNGDIVRGLLLREPNLDLLRVQDVGLRNAEDPDIVSWAISNSRIILTHDRATMPDFFYANMAQGIQMPGMFVVNDRTSTRQIIDEILLITQCSEPKDWENLVLYLPL